MTKVTKAIIAKTLEKVIDPEIGINIVDLGLLYDIHIKRERVDVLMTLTTMGCPLGPHIVNQVQSVLKELPSVKQVNVEFIWHPAWRQTMMSEKARDEMTLRMQRRPALI